MSDVADALSQARTGVALIVAARARCQARLAKLQADAESSYARAERAMIAGDEPEARRALDERGRLRQQLEGTEADMKRLQGQEEQLRGLVRECEQSLRAIAARR